MISTPRPTLFPHGGKGLIAAIAILALAPASASATIMIMAPTINLPYSATARSGSFEIYVESDEATQPQIGADNVQLHLGTSPGVIFTLPADPTPTVYPYLFNSQTPTSMILNSNLTVEGTDFAQSTPPTLANGSGLLLVDYQIAAGAVGSFSLNFVSYSPPSNPVGTTLFDSHNQPLAVTLQNGSINIGAPTPEPAGRVLALIAALGAGAYAWRSRRAAVG